MKWQALFLSFFVTTLASAQALKKYAISSSGCSVYMLCDPGEFEMTYSEDSAKVYTGECKADGISYGLICVKLKGAVDAGQQAEDLMITYLDYLKTAFKIKSSAGYGKGHTLEKKPDAKGVIDYWTDDTGNEWKVKAWTDGKFIAVLYVYAAGKLEDSPRQDVYLNSFRFPGM
jgi:hypothetical protein